MQFWRKIGVLLLGMLLIMGSVWAGEKDVDKEKATIRNKAAASLQRLYTVKPKAEKIIKNCDGYAVFFNTGMKLGFVGGSHGRGVAVNNHTGEEVFMKMGEYSAGLGLGVKEYDLIFVFGTQDAYNRFVNSGWKCNAGAEITAKNKDEGGAWEGAVCLGNEMWIYQMTTRGLMAAVEIKGTEYYRNKKLSPGK